MHGPSLDIVLSTEGHAWCYRVADYSLSEKDGSQLELMYTDMRMLEMMGLGSRLLIILIRVLIIIFIVIVLSITIPRRLLALLVIGEGQLRWDHNLAITSLDDVLGWLVVDEAD
jgi:hypothetical protein